MIISNDESSHETIWSILKDSISTSQLVLGLYLTFYLFWPTKTRKSPTSKGCNLRRDPQHATGPTCWYRKTVAHDVRKSKESPHPVLSCDEKNYVIYIYIYIQRFSEQMPQTVVLYSDPSEVEDESLSSISSSCCQEKVFPQRHPDLSPLGPGEFAPGSRRPSEIDSRPQRLTCWKKWCQNWNYPIAGRRTKSFFFEKEMSNVRVERLTRPDGWRTL